MSEVRSTSRLDTQAKLSGEREQRAGREREIDTGRENPTVEKLYDDDGVDCYSLYLRKVCCLERRASRDHKTRCTYTRERDQKEPYEVGRSVYLVMCRSSK